MSAEPAIPTPPRPVATALAYALATVVSVLVLYPYWWMPIGALRTTQDLLANPLRLWPEHVDLSVFADLGSIGGVPLWR